MMRMRTTRAGVISAGGALVVVALLAAGFFLFDAAAMGRLVAGFVFLIGGAELLIRGSVAVARRLGVSSLLIGLTVVAFGTSAPELATGIGAVLRDVPEINVGNVVGSNIANIGLILGLTAVVYPIACSRQVIRNEIPLMLLATVVGIVVMLDDSIRRWEGLLLIAALFAFFARSRAVSRRESAEDRAIAQELAQEQTGPLLRGPSARWLGPLLVVLGIGALVAGADLLVGGATAIARDLGVSPLIIALTMVAFGTSLPELATSLVAALRRETDIAVGNVLGSNIFNLLCVLGVTAAIKPVDVPRQALALDCWVMLGFAVACAPIVWTGRRITRLEGLVLFIGYLGYVTYLALSGGS